MVQIFTPVNRPYNVGHAFGYLHELVYEKVTWLPTIDVKDKILIHIQSTPLNWDTSVPGILSRLTENFSINFYGDDSVPGDLSQLSGVDCIYIVHPR